MWYGEMVWLRLAKKTKGSYDLSKVHVKQEDQ
jgi:hypothetical protein